jgi:hypothetical protein
MRVVRFWFHPLLGAVLQVMAVSCAAPGSSSWDQNSSSQGQVDCPSSDTWNAISGTFRNVEWIGIGSGQVYAVFSSSVVLAEGDELLQKISLWYDGEAKHAGFDADISRESDGRLRLTWDNVAISDRTQPIQIRTGDGSISGELQRGYGADQCQLKTDPKLTATSKQEDVGTGDGRASDSASTEAPTAHVPNLEPTPSVSGAPCLGSVSSLRAFNPGTMAYVNGAVVVQSSRGHVHVSIAINGASTRISNPGVTQVDGGYQWIFTNGTVASVSSGTTITFYYKTSVDDTDEKKLSCIVP